MKYYAVIDTNVLVSAMLKWNSVPGSVLELVLSGAITPILNEEILSEYQQVLSRPKFHFGQQAVQDILLEILRRGLFAEAEKLDEVLPDPKDQVFYEVVMEGRKTEDAYLVTGNMKHFPRRPFIVTPRQMLDIILEDAALPEEES